MMVTRSVSASSKQSNEKAFSPPTCFPFRLEVGLNEYRGVGVDMVEGSKDEVRCPSERLSSGF